MTGKYYWKVNGNYYEVSRDKYFEYRREQSRHNYLKQTAKDVVVLSADALNDKEFEGIEVMKDENTNVEETAIHNIMIEKLRKVLKTLPDDELYLIDTLIYQEKTERELARTLNISQQAVHKRKARILEKLKKFLEK